ncbi:MAG: nitroreductase/quinone reductase family protein [Novosphingobium sp.]
MMSDESSAEIAAARKDWKTEHMEMYIGSGGTQGHIMDITPVGGPVLGTHCMIRCKGRKSGRTLITPLCYAMVGGEVLICGSKGGADSHPNWYLNLIVDPRVEFQIGTQAWQGKWREPVGEEREFAWKVLTSNFGFYNDYQASTDRVLPLILMSAVEPIPVFTTPE